MPTLSVITVCLNACDTIEDTIISVIGQTFSDCEYIIIDGGSTDGTVDIIKNYQDRIAYWVSESDGGISEAFNKGIKASSGNWINFLNSGDVFVDENIVEKIVPFFRDSDIITGFAKFGKSSIPKKVLTNEDDLTVKAMISHQASFVKKKVFDQVGWFDANFRIRMDYDFWLRTLKYYEFLFIRSALVVSRPVGLSGSNPYLFSLEEAKANKKNFDNYLFNNFKILLRFLPFWLLQKYRLGFNLKLGN